MQDKSSDLRLAHFKIQFEALSKKARLNLSWNEVVQRIEYPVDFLLEKLNKLENPRIFKIDSQKSLIFFDGSQEVPYSTLKKPYSISYKKAKDQGLEFFTVDEYLELQEQSEPKYDMIGLTYLESGENPDLTDTKVGWWSDCDRMVYACSDYPFSPSIPFDMTGVRRLLRVKVK